jgi:hypothetical protein
MRMIRPQPKPEPTPKAKVITKRTLAATYAYQDETGAPLYQVRRWEWLEDGRRRKSFSQHRYMDDFTFADSISAGLYRKTPEGWKRLRGAENPQEGDVALGAVPHALYRLPELIEALASERATIIAEGEKDVETLWSLGSTRNYELRGCSKLALRSRRGLS